MDRGTCIRIVTLPKPDLVDDVIYSQAQRNMGLHDGVNRQEVFLIFAAFSVIAFLLDRSAALIPMKFVRDTFYMFRPIFLIIALLLLSLISSSVIFIIGYFTLLLWV